MYTLFGTEGSGSAAIEIALWRCSVPFTLFRACAWEEGPGKEALRRVNPLLQVPTLVLADGTVLTESAAILIHLGLEHPESGLLPSKPAQQACPARSSPARAGLHRRQLLRPDRDYRLPAALAVGLRRYAGYATRNRHPRAVA
ncbi:Uncharacterized protein ALO71_00817 [Pseudomonas amygdali pv. dendropanacis]|uniref:GST N-terminal domain-containing protein n=1 Tax=Pseudomonas amygdali pv. dendropanacis TaxID=235272 RepID=A0A0P9PS80_PSEA0|nr:Uncharacterized protein ALO71_00817 [Pseudomonas amygdali pv. dendropanacis]